MSKKPSLIGERMKQPIALEKKIAIVSVVLSQHKILWILFDRSESY